MTDDNYGHIDLQLFNRLEFISVNHPGSVAAYIAGSRAQGFATATSDVDLVVITESVDTALETGCCSFHDGDAINFIDIDVRVLSRKTFRESLCDGLIDTPSSLDTCSASCFDPELFSALQKGIAVMGEPVLEDIRSSIPWGGIREHMMQSLRELAMERIADAEAAIANHFAYSARWCSRAALDAAVDFITVSYGNLDIKPKWRLHRIENMGFTSLCEKYLTSDLEMSIELDDSLVAAGARIRLAESIVTGTTDGEAGSV